MTLSRTGVSLSLKVALLVHCWSCSDTSDTDSAKLLRRLGYRPIEARLTLDTGHVPCTELPATTAESPESALCIEKLAPVTCSPRPRLGTPALDRLRTLIDHLTAAAEPSLHARLQAILLWQTEDSSHLEAEISRFEHALENRGGDAGALSDLSAAYFHLATLTGRPDLLFDAYESATAALRAEPGHREALFNSALVLTRLNLPVPARNAWDAYLAQEEAGPWADEARRHRDALGDLEPTEESPALAAALTDPSTVAGWVARNPQQVREWAELDLVGAWANAHLARDPDAGTLLNTARQTAALIAEISGDQMFAEGVQVIERTTQPSKVDELARGHRDLAFGYRLLYDDWDLDEAATAFRAAHQRFAGTGSPYVLWASFYEGLLHYYKNRFLQSRDELQRLKSGFSSERYPVLYGRISWILGLDNANLQEYESAAEEYTHAVEAFCRAREHQNLAAAQGLLASALSELGRRDETWIMTRSALSYSRDVFKPVRRQAILQDAAYNAQRQGRHLVALAFADEFLRAAYDAGDLQVVHNALMRRASLLHSLRKTDEARAEFAEAVQALEKLHNPEIALRGTADHTLEVGRAILESDPNRAIEDLTLSIEAQLQIGSFLKLPAVYGLRGEAFLKRAGQVEPLNSVDLEKAERDFAQQLYLLDLARRGVILEEDRNLYVRETADAYDRMIAFQAGVRRRPEQAFRYAEIARAALFETWARQAGLNELDRSLEAPDVPPIEAFQVLLSENEAAVEYVVLKDKILIWGLTRDDFFSTEAAIDQGELRQLVDDLLTATLKGQGNGYREPAQRLYNLLIAPIGQMVDRKLHLTIVADKVLHELPFDLLLNPSSARLLIEDHEATMVPSFVLFRRLLNRARDLDLVPGPRVVSISGTAGKRPALPVLRNAESEARSIADLYGGETLMGDAISPASLISLLHDASIFHFAGHVEADEQPPHLPRLILVDEEHRPSVLSASRLRGEPFGKMRLVVLSGCRSAQTVDGSGFLLGIARPFLATGVPSVIGSHWDVDDLATANLFIAFHRALSSGSGVASALRQAKLSLLRGNDLSHQHPVYWAGFSLIGVGQQRLRLTAGPSLP